MRRTSIAAKGRGCVVSPSQCVSLPAGGVSSLIPDTIPISSCQHSSTRLGRMKEACPTEPFFVQSFLLNPFASGFRQSLSFRLPPKTH